MDKKHSILLSSFMLAVLFLTAGGCQQCKKRLGKSGSPTSNSGGNLTGTVQPFINPIELSKNGVSPTMLSLTGNNPNYSFLHKILEDIRDGNPVDIEVQCKKTDSSSTTALAQAVALNDSEIINLLLQKEIDQYSADKRYANTALVAAQTLDLPLLKFLLKQPGIKLNVTDVAGTPVLCTMIRDGDFSEKKKDFLTAFLADPTKFDINATDVLGNTALHSCFMNTYIVAHAVFQKDVLKKLLQVGGINLQIKNGRGETPLHVAVNYKAALLKDLLEAAGSNSLDLNLQNHLGETVLYRLMVSKDWLSSPEVLQWLLDKGANFNIPDYNGDTPLHAAIKANDLQWLGRLLMVLQTYKSILNFTLLGADNKTVEEVFQERMQTINNAVYKSNMQQRWGKLHT